MDESQVLTLFIEAVKQTPLAMTAFADALEEAGHPLAWLARELADASPAIPEDVQSITSPLVLARGTGWAVEYRPGRPVEMVPGSLPIRQSSSGTSAQVLPVYDDTKGTWSAVSEWLTNLAPAGVDRSEHPMYALQAEVSPAWVADAFAAVRLNMLSCLLCGCQVAQAPAGVPGRRLAIALKPLEDRLRILLLQQAHR